MFEVPGDGGSLSPAASELVRRTAVRAERAVSIIRIGFCVAILARHWGVSFDDPEVARLQAWVVYPAVLLPVVLSLVIMMRADRTKRHGRLLLLSVSLDAVLCTTALLPNLLWPGPGYRGLINMPDLGALLLVTVAAGLRLSPRVATIGGLLNGLGFTTLMAWDYQRTGPPAQGPYLTAMLLFALYLAGAAALAVLVAVAAGRLIERSARQASQIERTHNNLNAILGDHHDIRSLLSSAALNVGLMDRKLKQEIPPVTPLRDLHANLRRDLDDIQRLVNQIQNKAQGEVMARATRASVPLAATVENVTAVARQRFPEIAVSVDNELGDTEVVVAGGGTALRRLLFNIVINACEGNGLAAAQTVRVNLRRARRDGWACIDVVDDGPGFPEAIPAESAGLPLSTKPYGSGVGLAIVANLVRASAGSLSKGNTPVGGAWVQIELPVAAELGISPA